MNAAGAAPAGACPTWRRRAAVALAVGLLFALLALCAPATATAPPPATSVGIGIRLVEVPAGLRDPRAKIYLVGNLAPGEALHRKFEVTNTAATTQHVRLYVASAHIAAGRFVGDPGTTQNALSRWSSISADDLDLPPGGTSLQTITVAVPPDGGGGEQYAVLWAEVSSTAPMSAGSASPAIREVNRVGIRLYISTGPGSGPRTDFSITSLTASRAPGGAPQLAATVRNTGGRAVDLRGELTLSDGPGGTSAGPYQVAQVTVIAPGQSQSVVFGLANRLPVGPWLAQVTLTDGVLTRQARARLAFPDDDSTTTTAAAAVTPHRGQSRWQWWLVGGAALLAVVVIAVAVVGPGPGRRGVRPR